MPVRCDGASTFFWLAVIHRVDRALKLPRCGTIEKVEKGGYAVVWNSDIDISEHELWSYGQEVPG